MAATDEHVDLALTRSAHELGRQHALADAGLAADEQHPAARCSTSASRVSRMTASAAERPTDAPAALSRVAARAGGGAAVASSAGSWASSRCSRVRTVAEGSTPNPATSAERRVRSVSRASACRSQRYCARASSDQSRSRYGWAAASAATTTWASSARPRSRSACARASTRPSRTSSSLVDSTASAGASRRPAYGAPRQRASAVAVSSSTSPGATPGRPTERASSVTSVASTSTPTNV